MSTKLHRESGSAASQPDPASSPPPSIPGLSPDSGTPLSAPEAAAPSCIFTSVSDVVEGAAEASSVSILAGSLAVSFTNGLPPLLLPKAKLQTKTIKEKCVAPGT
ncbi:uncharacterized protein LOC132631566 isoform X2 [Lycium barbarum]|uniref:uncharacterized protein LOC132631566 isoform X2 n=1 Tax=Lycium barbarum TaxID=112863 RepID=UPI00293E12C0|nr:uncharacterized protein LOC132631566 isoform X2 [Lycium barbarum]